MSRNKNVLHCKLQNADRNAIFGKKKETIIPIWNWFVCTFHKRLELNTSMTCYENWPLNYFQEQVYSKMMFSKGWFILDTSASLLESTQRLSPRCWLRLALGVCDMTSAGETHKIFRDRSKQFVQRRMKFELNHFEEILSETGTPVQTSLWSVHLWS